MKNIIMFSSVFFNEQIDNHLRDMCRSKHKATYIPAGTDFGLFDGSMYFEMGFRKAERFSIGYDYDESKVCEVFDTSDMIHIGGGNTFLLKYLLQQRGLFQIIRDYVDNGGVLIGNSAGSIVMCEDIQIANIADQNITQDNDYKSLGLVDFEFKPHFQAYKTNMPFFRMYSDLKNKKLYGVDEESAIIIKSERIIEVGNVVKIMPRPIKR